MVSIGLLLTLLHDFRFEYSEILIDNAKDIAKLEFKITVNNLIILHLLGVEVEVRVLRRVIGRIKTVHALVFCFL